MKETTYQLRLINRIQRRFTNCVVLKNDPRYVQGVPDIIILYGNTWAMLEVKMDAQANVQPNQAYYIDLFDSMSFASFINPKIEEDVLNDLQRAFGYNGETRVS